MKLKTPLQLYLWTRRQARTDGGGEKESSGPELCNLESVCGQACIYRHIARCVFTTILINHKYSCSVVFNFINLKKIEKKFGGFLQFHSRLAAPQASVAWTNVACG